MTETRCPDCGSKDIKSNPTVNGPKQYRCLDCGKVFEVQEVNTQTLREGVQDVKELKD